MKKGFFILFFSMLALAASAQEGKWFAGTASIGVFDGGTGMAPFTGFMQDKSGNGEKMTRIGLAPELGYFFTDKFCVGMGVFYSHVKLEAAMGKTKLNIVGFNPYACYYFWGVGNFSFYARGGIDFASMSVKDGGNSTYFAIGVYPGITYNLTEAIALSASFGQLAYQDFDNDSSSFGLSLDANTLNFGFTVTF
ncbi:porin family protein [Porphyromonadaceae bacterium OttesenSCG-928-L07]|nr:porin family protein [Porphyromonadaceae bacterium OttesenSCG-928-L07]MDL2330802.1 porin family protein [Odoribacter sp. OttesenSCG-928-A06]